ncbi:hypothetical protein K474DRAFT_1703168 [Panus rudis PR-1116 ss-1]|nr:hypothetical protein K474DRAFT_1703168 [Panus rudis PR-1116 ss-1]
MTDRSEEEIVAEENSIEVSSEVDSSRIDFPNDQSSAEEKPEPEGPAIRFMVSSRSGRSLDALPERISTDVLRLEARIFELEKELAELTANLAGLTRTPGNVNDAYMLLKRQLEGAAVGTQNVGHAVHQQIVRCYTEVSRNRTPAGTALACAAGVVLTALVYVFGWFHFNRAGGEEPTVTWGERPLWKKFQSEVYLSRF